MATDIAAKCRTEVTELHAFFERMFNGELADTDAEFSRFFDVLAEGFHIIAPDGRVTDREACIAAVRAASGSGASADDRRVGIRIRNHTHRMTLGDVAIVNYEEWQTRGDDVHAWLSTAVLRIKPGLPNDLEWLHVHETYLPGREPASGGS